MAAKKDFHVNQKTYLESLSLLGLFILQAQTKMLMKLNKFKLKPGRRAKAWFCF